MQLTGHVTPELRKVRLRAVRQVYFNLNGKMDCKALSSLKVFMYIYARLVAHRISQIYAEIKDLIYPEDLVDLRSFKRFCFHI
jgi:hypothetical protein